MPGTSTSQINSQITSIESDGLWLLTAEGEFFVSFDRYPAFKEATINQVFRFRESFGDFHWDELDIDIELDALKHPEQYPLVFQDVRQVA
jgi:hypothetical protein